MEEFKPGDILVAYGKGRLGRAKHVSLIVSLFGTPCVYESTMDERPQCIRTGRDTPKGVQAHHINDVMNADVYRLSLKRPLYPDEEDRLLAVAESCLGRGWEFIGGTTSSAFVARVLGEVGVLCHRNALRFSPRQLTNYVVRQGIYKNPVAIL